MTRRRLKNRNERHGSATGFSVAGALLFGGVFVAAGTAITLIGAHVIPVSPGSVHAPYWVLLAVGLSFTAGGLAVWGMASKQLRAEQRRRFAAKRHGESPALTDYEWDVRGYAPRRWARAMQSLAGAAFMTLFLSIFNWWAWGADGPWVVKLIVVLFDVIIVVVWWQTALRFGRAVKFSGSRVIFSHFPYQLAKPVVFSWVPPRGIASASKGSFTFRCVEEYYERTGTGDNASTKLVHDELCAETQSFESTSQFVSGLPVEFRFQAPEGAAATSLATERALYWEFEVKLSMRGLDFEEWYLIPIYSEV